MSCIAKGVGCVLAASLIMAPAAAQLGSAVRLPSNQELQVHGLEMAWYAQVSLDPRSDHIRDIGFDGRRLYAQTNRGVVHALDSETGRTAWIAQVGDAERVSFTPSANSTHLFVVNGTQLFVLDKNTGAARWRARLPGSPSGPLAATDDFIYVGFVDGHLRAYDVRQQAQAWFYRTGKPISIPALPIAGLGFVAFASQDGSLYVSLADQRQILFQYETDYPVAAALANQGDRILMASEDYKLYALHARTGHTEWVHTLGNPIVRPLTTIEDEIYVTPERGGMYRLEAESGNIVWWSAEATDFLAAGPQRVYATDGMGNLLIIERDSGRRLGRLDARRFPLYVRNAHNDRVYMASRNGLLIGLHDTGLESAAFHPTAPTTAESPKDEQEKPEKAAAPAGEEATDEETEGTAP